MKSILFMYHASNIGGGTYCLLNILKEIDRSKYRPVVLLRTTGDLVLEIKKLGIEVYYMNNMTLVPYNQSIFGRNTLRLYANIQRSMGDFKNFLETLKVDAVYFNTMMLAPYLKVAKELGLKTFIHLREHWPLDEHVYQLKRIQEIIASYADEIIAINSYSASMIPNRKVTIVYDWINMDERYENLPFQRIIPDYNDKMRIYLFTGGIQLIKGTREIINIFSRNLKGVNNRLLMVGVDGMPSKHGAINKLKFYLSKLGIDSYEYKVWKLIKNDSRIICMPSNYYLKHIMEQCYCNLSFFKIPHANLALAESIIVGAIPIAARTSESLEYSNNGDLAILYDINSQKDLLDKLNYLDANYNKIKQHVVLNGYKIKEMFDRKHNSNKLASVYDILLENSKN